MISHLTGTVTHVGATQVVIDLGGFGLSVQCPPNTTSELRSGSRATLETSLVVREDSLTLFGFATAAQRDCFELVQSASGVGPRLAQAIVAVFEPDDLYRALSDEDDAALARVPGIGRKTAQRLILELRDKVTVTSAAGAVTPADDGAGWRRQVSAGLEGLGWSTKDAETATEKVAELQQQGAGVPELMRAALRSLAK
ncbi:Holliday junction branch migration protein RuvA [Parenemella sanctibonifatiensis]|uniref:Holliday junction branch migration complex subunit RuvA n=1 Tax=Parenemella sanctibonifatiensis TaxID=2016505 RepID=A0A255EAM2_9ACTN|nr:Holliday junction branch migration protein RuvA [Parenemella sanctibonifatiensis]OYN86545.1 Holliday junction branch migration protein RuvA [Parenemella sanctibonifatiensis]